MVWFTIASESSTGRMVRFTIAWPRLNSSITPRSEIIISTRIWDATGSEASTFASVTKPEVRISKMPRMLAIQAPATIPTASSSRVAGNAVK